MALVVISQEDLSQLIEDAVRKSIPKQEQAPQQKAERVTREQALSFLESKGFIVGKSLFYKSTSAKEIPCIRFGRRLLFNQIDLISWAESRCKPQNTRSNDVSEILAKSANRKGRAK